MLNEAPKKQKKVQDYSDPTPWQYFWRIQKECWRRMVSPYFMYMFLSMLALAVEAIVPGEPGTTVEIVLGSICIAAGAFFNAHLLYNTGKLHYDAYLTGCIHRKNRALGIQSGGDHRVEREYRFWKGFYIGILVGIPAIILSIIAGALPETAAVDVAHFFMVMFAGWAILPPIWAGGQNVSGYWSLLMVIMPVLVSGIAYIVGAMREKDYKAHELERAEAVKNAGKKGKQ